MAWNPISGTFIQYSEDDVDASGFYLKFYASGTVTPISMADDSTGGTLLAKCALDSDGMPINGSSAPFIPHIDQQYKIVIYRNATDADANTIGSAYKVIDEVTPPFSSSLFEESESVSGKVYGTLAIAKAATLTDGKLVDTKGYRVAGGIGAATYLVKTVAGYGGTPDGYGDHATDDGDFVLVLQVNGETNVLAYGAVGDETTDDTASLKAMRDANNGLIKLPKGYAFRITSNLTDGYTGELRLVGDTFSYRSQGHLTTPIIDSKTSTDFSYDFWTYFKDFMAVIVCDATYAIGGDDTALVDGWGTNIREVKNIAFVGINSAKTAVHLLPIDSAVQQCAFIQFGEHGLLTRAGTTSKFHDLGFVDCGFNKAATGNITSFPATYMSGCGWLASASLTRQNLLAVDSRPTTFDVKNTYYNMRDEIRDNREGLLSMQIHWPDHCKFDNVGGYTGAMFNGGNYEIVNYRFENYSANGLVNADATPITLLEIESAGFKHQGVAVYLGANSGAATLKKRVNSSRTSVTQNRTEIQDGVVTSDKYSVIRSTFSGTAQTGISGLETTVTVPFADLLQEISDQDNMGGFCGLVSVSVTRRSNANLFAKGLFFVSVHKSGTSTYEVMPSDPVKTYSTEVDAAATRLEISRVEFNDYTLEVDVDFGTNFTAIDNPYSVVVGLSGTAGFGV